MFWSLRDIGTRFIKTNNAGSLEGFCHSLDTRLGFALEADRSLRRYRKALWGLTGLLVGLDFFSKINQWETSADGSALSNLGKLDVVELSKEQEALQKTIGYRFKNRILFLQAHRQKKKNVNWPRCSLSTSCLCATKGTGGPPKSGVLPTKTVNRDTGCKNLEWIGDALIDLWISETLAKQLGNISCKVEFRDKIRNAAVHNESMVKLASDELRIDENW